MLVTSLLERNTTIRGSSKHCGNAPRGSRGSAQCTYKGNERPEVRPAGHRGQVLERDSRPSSLCLGATFLPGPGDHQKQRHLVLYVKGSAG